MPSFHNMPDEHSVPFYADPSYDFVYGWATDEDDYDPEPDPVYCAVCGDVEVEGEGNACDRCVDSDDDEMREMARVIRELDAVLAASPLTGGCRE